MFRTIALTSIAAFVAATTISLAPPAHAQIGNIFSEPTLRPPGNIPRGGNQPPPDDEEEVPELPQGRLLPTPKRQAMSAVYAFATAMFDMSDPLTKRTTINIHNCVASAVTKKLTAIPQNPSNRTGRRP